MALDLSSSDFRVLPVILHAAIQTKSHRTSLAVESLSCQEQPALFTCGNWQQREGQRRGGGNREKRGLGKRKRRGGERRKFSGARIRLGIFSSHQNSLPENAPRFTAQLGDNLICLQCSDWKAVSSSVWNLSPTAPNPHPHPTLHRRAEFRLPVRRGGSNQDWVQARNQTETHCPRGNGERKFLFSCSISHRTKSNVKEWKYVNSAWQLK